MKSHELVLQNDVNFLLLKLINRCTKVEVANMISPKCHSEFGPGTEYGLRPVRSPLQ